MGEPQLPKRTFVERAQLLLRDQCKGFLHNVQRQWPEKLCGDEEADQEAFFETFRLMVAAAPKMSREEKDEMDDLLGEEWMEVPGKDDTRLQSLLFFVRNFQWMYEDNAFEPGDAYSDSDDSVEDPTSPTPPSEKKATIKEVVSSSEDSDDEEEEEEEDERMFFITEVVLCRDTLNAVKTHLPEGAGELFRREEGLTMENYQAFHKLLKENIAYAKLDEERPKKRQKV